MSAEPNESRRPQLRNVGLLIAGVLLGSATAISGVIHRIVEGWQPEGDNAAIAWLTRDVLSSHIPLLGMPSTVGGLEASSAHHWGPLQFWFLAFPQQLTPNSSPVGLQIGLLLVALASMTGLVVFAHRRVGVVGTGALLVMVSIVTWSLGRHLLSSVWNPDLAILPLACLLVLAWSMAAGDDLAAPYFVLTASFVAQANLVYTPLVVALVTWAVIGMLISRRERRRVEGGKRNATDGEDPGARLGSRHGSHRRSWIGALVVLIVGWSGPILFELTNSPGNIKQVLTRASSEGGVHIGIARSADAIVHTIGMVPLFVRRLSSLFAVSDLVMPASLATAVSAIAIGLALLGGWIWMWRRDPELRALLGVAVFGLGGAFVGLARLPLLLGTTYRFWSLWLVGMFAWFALIMLAVRVVTTRWPHVARVASTPRGLRTIAIGLSVALAIGATAGTLTTTRAFMRLPEDSAMVSRLVRATARSLPKPGPYLAVQNANSVGSGVLWGLVRRGYDLRISKESPFELPALGEEHGPGSLRLPRLYLLLDPSPTAPDPAGNLIASAAVSTTVATRLGYVAARRAACRSFRVAPPHVTAYGRALADAAGRAPDQLVIAGLLKGNPPCDIFEYGHVQGLVDRGALDLDPDQVGELFKFSIAYFAAQSHRYEIWTGPPLPAG